MGADLLTLMTGPRTGHIELRPITQDEAARFIAERPHGQRGAPVGKVWMSLAAGAVIVGLPALRRAGAK